MAGGPAALIGRAAELEIVRTVLARHDGGAPVLQVAGEPGIGKTRFLVEVCRHAKGRGDLVFSGRAAEFERDLPFGVFADALDEELASLPVEFFERLGPDVLAELATAFRALEALAAGRPPAVQAERYRTCRAVRSLLEDLGRDDRAVTLVLDDVHWADPASTDVLLHLLAYPPRAGVRLVTAFRPGQTGHRLALALATSVRSGNAQRVDLPPLTPDEANQLIGTSVPAETRRSLYDESGGNPFYLEQLLRVAASQRARPLPSAGSPETGHVPAPVVAALEAELVALPRSARSLLEGASVAGDPFDLDLAATAAGLDGREALEALDVLVAASLARPTDVPRRFRFRHPIVRRAVYEAAGARRCIEAHGRLATSLAEAGAPASVLAHHIEHSAAVGDERAVTILVEAARAASARSPASAARWYGAALHLLPEGEDHDHRRLELMSNRAFALAAAGHIEESHEILCLILDRPLQGSPGPVGLTALCASLECLLGQSDRARGRLERALARLTDDDSGEAVQFEIELCATAQWSNDPAAGERWARRAFEGSRRIGDTGLEATASAMSALAAYDAGRLAEGMAHVDHAGQLIDGMTDGELAPHLEAPYYLSWASYLLERYDDALRRVERAIGLSRAVGHGLYLQPLLQAQLWPHVWRGNLARAEELADTAVEAALVAGNVVFHATCLYSRGLAATFAGDLDLAIECCERAVELVRPLDRNAGTAMPRVALGVALIEANQPERARTEVLAGAGGPDLPLMKGAMGLIGYEVLARADVALGRLDLAADWACAAADMVARWPLPIGTATGCRTQAHVLLAQGEARAAADLLAPAADAVAVVSPLEAGRTRLLTARAHAHSGRLETAVAELDRAEAELATCGACAYAGQAAAERQALRHRLARPPSRPSPLDVLTAREREIAGLVAAGRTNRQIAAACHVSEKTVERHLSQMFRKLGTSTRAGVAGIVAADLAHA